MSVANQMITVVRENFSNVLPSSGENKLLSFLILLLVDLFFFSLHFFIVFQVLKNSTDRIFDKKILLLIKPHNT